MTQLIDVGPHSNLWSILRGLERGLLEIVTAVDRLTEAIDRQTDKYESLMRELSEEKGKRK